MTINKITTAFNGKSYENYIHYIRFPKYKNISPNTQINFDFPITVLVGPNGSGKSSILKALYGAVEGNSLGDFWFETGIDKITDNEGNRNCFI
ncbi:MAG: AAA family ATPase, partial [Bacteroidales bacterium]